MIGLVALSVVLLAVVIVFFITVLGGDGDETAAGTSAPGATDARDVEPTAASVEPTAASVEPTAASVEPTATNTTTTTTTTRTRGTSPPRDPPVFTQVCVGVAEHRVPRPDEDLTTCMRGDRVESLQRALLAAGYALGADGADGYYGPNTQRAVWEFQRDQGLTPTGNAESVTRARLGVA